MIRRVFPIAALFLIPFALLTQAQPGASRLPEGVTTERDVVYSTVDGIDLALDVIYPANADASLHPLVVWIHGGAWLAGDKSGNPAAMLVSHGFAAASINYRLTQQAIWPAQIHDCKAAIRFLRAHAEQYRIDSKRIGVWGSSAGGHLAAMLGTSGGVSELEGDGGWLDQSSRVQAVCDFYGPTNFKRMLDQPSAMDHASADSPESRLVGGRVADMEETVRSADPITYINADDPPFLIAHGDRDMTVPFNQSQLLYDALQAANVESELIVVEGGGHGGWNGDTRPTQREINQRVIAFFEKHLK
ncbi:MAG: alpha/beta hydrolase fold domain-containing protein [bacterium]|nr:alpha/beta hydrolase fold domain-containing protein [bacterium]